MVSSPARGNKHIRFLSLLAGLAVVRPFAVDIQNWEKVSSVPVGTNGTTTMQMISLAEYPEVSVRICSERALLLGVFFFPCFSTFMGCSHAPVYFVPVPTTRSLPHSQAVCNGVGRPASPTPAFFWLTFVVSSRRWLPRRLRLVKRCWGRCQYLAGVSRGATAFTNMFLTSTILNYNTLLLANRGPNSASARTAAASA